MTTKDEDAAKVKQATMLKRALDELIENHAMEMNRQRIIARFAKLKFDAHMAEGFTEAQALALCRA